MIRYIVELAMRDLRERYISSYLGIIWSVVQPVVTVVLMWGVFSVGMKARPIGDVPFILWLIPGYLSWQYLWEVVSSGTSSIVGSSYLVKKIAFRVEILPLVKIASGLVLHGVMMVIMIMIYVLWGYELGAETLQLIYYAFAGSALTYGVIMITSSVAVLVRDMMPIVNMVMQLGFWGTPVFWEEGMIPLEYRWLVGINPLAYVVEGYRQSMLSGSWFWERSETIYYWAFTLILIYIGRTIFKKLRPQFADVL